jgi:DNA-binding transcriptional regulator YiaG
LNVIETRWHFHGHQGRTVEDAVNACNRRARVQQWATVLVNGAAVRAIREALGLSQRATAEAASVGRSHLANVEAGRRPLSPSAAKRLASALRVPITAILRDPGDAP